MLLGRLFSYPDTHRYRIGPNYKQIPVNRPKVAGAHATPRTARCGTTTVGDPVYAPNSYGGPTADPPRTDDGGLGRRRRDGARRVHAARRGRRLGPGRARWSARCSTTPPAIDWSTTSSGHLLNGVSEPVLARAFEYWRNVDKELGDRVEQGVRAKQDETDPKAAQQANPARSAARAKA